MTGANAMDDDDLCNARQCHDCGKAAPSVATDFTLVSARYAWRLLRSMDGGHLRLEWRCPPCWARYKAARVKQVG
jgi:hypothetical protein